MSAGKTKKVEGKLFNKCACGSGELYPFCCKPYHDGEKRIPDARTLMRARYAAYAHKNVDFIIRTYLNKKDEPAFREQLLRGMDGVEWRSLNIIKCEPGSHENEAFVEYVAKYTGKNKDNSVEHKLHELSRFLKVDTQWFYVDGIKPKLQRNGPCYCGSGKKYKVCCL